jgi:PAS domain S-box-containing protein
MKQPTDPARSETASAFSRSDEIVHEHLVQFYEDEDVLTDSVARFIGEALPVGAPVTIIATERNRHAFQRRLETNGFDIGKACGSGQLLFLDAHETLSKFMRNGQPDSRLFEAEVGKLIANQARSAGSIRLRAYGEMVDVLWKQGERAAALLLEGLWNDLQSRHSFTLLCAYAMANFYKEPAALQRVCATHTHVMEGGETTAPGEVAPYSTSLPPQYARRLAKEIAQREEIDVALRDTLRKLRDSEEQLRDFIENANVGLHRVGADGTILWANRAELDMLGYAEHEYVGRRIAEFHIDASVIRDVLERLSAGEALHDYEARLRAKDGSIRHVLVNSSVYTRDGKFVHTRCFTRDITERRNAEMALRERERQLQLVTDAIPALVSYVDAGHRYRFASAAYERWFGLPKDQVVGKHLSEVLGAEAYELIRPNAERALSGETVIYETEVSYSDGRARFIEATYVPQTAVDGTVPGFVALVSDITERKNFERFRQRAAARAERLATITGAIANAVTNEQVFEALVDRLHEAVAATSTALWLVDEDGKTARLARVLGYSEAAKRRFETLPLDLEPPIPAIDSMRRGEALWIGSQAELVQQYPHLATVVSPGQSYSVCCLPLIAHGRVLGTLGLTIQGGRDIDDDERAFLLLAARYASQAVERLRLFDAERRSRAAADAAARRMGALSNASRVFVETSLDLDSRLQGIVAELGSTLGGCVGLSLLKQDGLLHTCAVYHPVPEARERLKALSQSSPLRVGEGVTGGVVADGKSVLIPLIDSTEFALRAAPAYRDFLERYPVYGMICVPLRVRNQVIGAVTATRTRNDHAYTAEDLQLFEQLAERAAAAIENSRLYEETVDARLRAEELYQFAHAVVVADRVEAVFDAALIALEGALQVKRASVLTLDRAGVMRFAAWRNLSEEYRRAVDGHSPWAADAAAPEPILVSDAQGDPAMAAYAEIFQKEGIGALAFIPLVAGGRLLGKFMMYYEKPHAFASFEVETARAIANHLASVMVRFSALAELREQVRANELFAGVLAHDLLTPLGAITSGAQVLLMRHEGELATGDTDRKPLSRILSSGQRMNRMVEQLLDFTRARTGGGIQIQPRPTHLGDVCAQVLGELDLAHPEWTIETEVVGDVAGTWDADRLLQIISNLIANAGQHGTPHHAILVRLDGTAAAQVKLEVHNEGSVPDALLPYLFDPFRTARTGRERSRGLGLGLYIVRELVQIHRGTVDVSSGGGRTTFTVTLPRHASDPIHRA